MSPLTYRRRLELVAAVALTVITAACSEKSTEASQPVASSKVLAQVGGETITAADVDAMLGVLLPADRARSASKAERAQALQAVVERRTVALARLRKLSTLERENLQADLAAQREEQLIRRYLDAHKLVTPVSEAAISAHYAKHPEQYGAREVRRYEVITTERALSPDERTVFEAAVAGAGAQSDWSAWTKGLGGKIQLVHRTSQDERVLHPRLRKELAALQAGASSGPVYVQGVPFVLRSSAVTSTPARPLEEVAPLIRRQLQPTQLQAAIAAASDDLLKKAKVEYP